MFEHMTQMLRRRFFGLGVVEILDPNNRSALILTGLDLDLYYTANALADYLNESGYNITVL